MAYNTRDRLAYNAIRHKQTNYEDVLYTRAGEDPVTLSDVSPIIHRPMELSSDSSNLIRAEMQCFGIDVADLGALNLWPPIDTDIITRTSGEEFRVTKPDNNSPPYEYTTSARTRILLYTKRQKGPT